MIVIIIIMIKIIISNNNKINNKLYQFRYVRDHCFSEHKKWADQQESASLELLISVGLLIISNYFDNYFQNNEIKISFIL